MFLRIVHYFVLSGVRFLDDVEVMLKWRPPAIYKYMWKYVCLLAMVGLLAASLLQMFFKWPTYTAWNHNTVKEHRKLHVMTVTLQNDQG